MRALLERGGELSELAEDNAAVPFRVLDVLAVFLVRGLGCERQSGEAAVVVGTNFGIAAKEADEGDVVVIHGGDLRFVEFPVSCSGHPSPKRASGPCSQGRSSAFTEGPSQMETVTRRAFAAANEAEERACRRAQERARSVIPSRGRDRNGRCPNVSTLPRAILRRIVPSIAAS